MDMETILLFGVAVCFFSIVYGIVRIVKLVMEQRAYAKHREEQARQIAIEETRKWRESLKNKAVEKPLHKESPSDLAYMREHNLITSKQHRDALAAQKPSFAPSATQSVSQYQDNFLSDVVTSIAINSILANTHKSADTEERSVGVRQTETSWGFDDSDSRKSISSSMDTSSSWSSSSSSDSYSSSSSDSGPSSDW